VELAELAGRSPSAVAMKLANSASLDPLANTSEADRAVWREFHRDWERLAIESEPQLTELSRQAEEPVTQMPDDEDTDGFRVPTEAGRLLKVRLGQQFFRTTILTSYRCRCCVCGIPIRGFLIASHILPWNEQPHLRVNPHNGLCLCAIHDRAFDTGLLGIEPIYTVVISPEVDAYLPNDALSNGFIQCAGHEIALPDKFMPDPDFLDHHVSHVFRVRA
jgi:putative restriction endonuclease